MSLTYKQGDTRPAGVWDLRDNFGLQTEGPLDLTNATTVAFIMRTTGETTAPKVRAAATITDAVNGRVQRAWAAGDLDTVGTYDVEFEITWSDGGIETVPNTGYLQVEVVDDLDI